MVNTFPVHHFGLKFLGIKLSHATQSFVFTWALYTAVEDIVTICGNKPIREYVLWRLRTIPEIFEYWDNNRFFFHWFELVRTAVQLTFKCETAFDTISPNSPKQHMWVRLRKSDKSWERGEMFTGFRDKFWERGEMVTGFSSNGQVDYN